MPCENYREALTEAAATGAAPSREVRSHMDACASCSAAFAEELQLFAAMDAGIRVAANSEVPISFLPHVRARLEDVAAPRSRSMGSLIFAGAAVAIALLAFMATHARHPKGDDLARQIPVTPTLEAQTPAGGDASGSPAVQASVHRNQGRVLRSASTLHGTASPSTQLEVIVPPDERVALARFVASMREGSDVTAALVRPASDKKDGPMSLTPLLIAKLEVKPLEKIGGEEPDSKEEEQ